MNKRFNLSDFPDEGYRFNDNITPDMTDKSMNESLYYHADDFMRVQHREPDIAYGILRELVWRSPCWKHEAWELPSKCATLRGQHEEAAKAKENGNFLKKRQPN